MNKLLKLEVIYSIFSYYINELIFSFFPSLIERTAEQVY